MSGYVDWIAAAADEDDRNENDTKNEPNSPESFERGQSREPSPDESLPGRELWRELRLHSFPARQAFDEAQLEEDPLDRNPDLWLYRKRTVSLLRRYWRFSLETGRLPSFVGREFFRAKVTYYSATTFEDRVIFVRDVEKSLDRLEYWDQQLIARIILQEHSQEQAARILHWGLRTVERRLPQALDLLSEDFLRVGLLAEAPSKRKFSE
ncbi:MAG TPA: hypothetical protein VN310_16805 [Candidatus Dormibacteraeota bacterium]|jgi:hypothetical protein|nr:hypothetical protein [Candidatus Dormibacteraeota bacterium]